MNVNVLRFFRRSEGFKEVFHLMKENEFKNKQILVVPKVFEVECQKALFEELDCESTFFMEVTSFDELVDEYVDCKDLEYLSKSEGVMLVQKIAQEIKCDLKVLGRSCDYNGFCENVFDTIMLLKNSLVAPDLLLSAISNLLDISHLKLLDIQKIYTEYQSCIKNKYVDSSDKLELLANQIHNICDINKIDFYIYLPKMSKRILNVCECFIKNANSVTFLLDCYDDDSIIFDANILEIQNLCKKIDCDVNEKTIKKVDTLSSQLKSLGTNKKFQNDNIFISQEKNIQDELSSVLINILNSGTRYKDNAILVCDLEKYKTTIERVCDSFSIAYDLDAQVQLSSLAPIKFVVSLLEIICDFKIDKTLSIIKSGYFPYKQAKIDNFDLYINRWGVNDFNFFNESKPNDNIFDDFNSIYQDFCEFYNQLKNSLSTCVTYGNFIEKLFDFLNTFDFENKINSEIEKLNLIKETQKATLYYQIFKKLSQVLNQLNSILGETKVSLQDFVLVLKAGINSVSIKTNSAVCDAVAIKDVASSMLFEYKNIFVVGATEGVFPNFNQDCGLILDSELEKMRDIVCISPTIRETNNQNVCDIMNNLCCADKLYLSYPVSLFYAEQTSSTLFENIKKMFSKFDNNKNILSYSVPSLLDAPNILAKNIITSIRAEEYIRSCEDFGNLLSQSRKASIAKKLGIILDKNEILPLIPRQMKNTSVTQIQSYFNCPYNNFLKYGLRLKENLDYSIKRNDVGTFMHKVCELYGRYLISNGIKFVDDEKIFASFCNSALEYLDFDAGGEVSKVLDSKQKMLIQNLVHSAEVMLHIINEQNKNSDFVITNVEEPISYQIDMQDYVVKLKGQIDRVDTCGKNFRIIDYKTGSDTYKEIELLTGRKIQLFVYLGALQKIKKLVPTATYYFKIQDNFVDPQNENEYLKAYSFNGVSVNESELLLAQDTSINESHTKSEIINCRGKFEDDEYIPYKSKNLVTREKMEELIQYSLDIFRQGIYEISLGNIEKSPYKDACKFCPYKGVLCFGSDKERIKKEVKDK